jgi:chemotaxis protein methyltransferase CheR
MIQNSLNVSKEEFLKFQNFIEKKIGIKFPQNKKSLLESRLSSHIVKLGMKSFEEYYNYLNNNNQKEYDYFIDKITTHTTNFFREKNHFNFIIDKGINIINEYFNNPKIKVLSLGTSTGEEIYTLAMIFARLKKMNEVTDYEIHGADVSKIALLKAKKGVFKTESLKDIPEEYQNGFKKYNNLIIANKIIRYNLRFFLLNACKRDQNFPDEYHIVFCRNIFIYFKNELQQNILDNIFSALLDGGLLFTGHTESLFGFNHNLKKIGTSVYRNEKVIND